MVDFLIDYYHNFKKILVCSKKNGGDSIDFEAQNVFTL
jgi:hypothetical protein